MVDKPDLKDKLSIDILSPAAVTAKAESIGVTKARNDLNSLLMLGILAGAFIALAGEFYTIAVYDGQLSESFAKVLGGLAFSLGLILVVITGAELFTGNTLLVIAYMTRKISFTCLLRNWAIVYIGNFIGSLAIVLLVYYAQQWKLGGNLFGVVSIKIALGKVSNDFATALIRGVLANLLVVLAVWMSYSGRSATDKILAIIFPITAFVSSGFEHCIANMYFIPFGLMLKTNEAVRSAFTSLYPGQDLAQLTVSNFVLLNLIPVTIGNIIGGAFLVGLVYWFVYLHKKQ